MASPVLAAVMGIGLASCASAPGPPTARLGAYCRYTAASPTARPPIPAEVYVFPPLLADSKGKPLQEMKPLADPSGGIREWACPSERSRKIRENVARQLKDAGYQVVDFNRVTSMETPHSILMLSLFYARAEALQEVSPKGPDHSMLTMIRARTFDVDLNPATAQRIADVDGVTYFKAAERPAELEEKSFRVLQTWIGENVSGFIDLSPPAP
ncbi:MAG: hypothetical protein QM680_01680 [Luteolibacter sp.]